jgi:hypothetical protein
MRKALRRYMCNGKAGMFSIGRNSPRGPTQWHTAAGVPIVPVVPSVARWQSRGKPCSRAQFPLRLAYAISIHKSQGMTLNKAIVDLGEKDFVRRLSFMAISRVGAIADIAFLSRIFRTTTAGRHGSVEESRG